MFSDVFFISFHDLPLDTRICQLSRLNMHPPHIVNHDFGVKPILRLPPNWSLVRHFLIKVFPYWTHICVCMGKWGNSTKWPNLKLSWFMYQKLFWSKLGLETWKLDSVYMYFDVIRVYLFCENSSFTLTNRDMCSLGAQLYPKFPHQHLIWG